MRQLDLEAVDAAEALGALLSHARTDANGRMIAQCGDHRMHSHFQPIVSLPHQRVVGFEALARPVSGDGQAVPPASLFAAGLPRERIVEMDRLCRLVHARNFSREASADHWLFLNVHPEVVAYGRRYGAFFADLLRYCGLSGGQVVLELVEHAVADEHLLEDAIAYYRSLGCLIAIDDFGTGESNFDRLWRLEPDIVKLDRRLAMQASASGRVRRVLPSLVALIHESGSLVLQEGLETEDQLLMTLDAGVDLVQGYHLGRPARTLAAGRLAPAILDRVNGRYRDEALTLWQARQHWIDREVEAFAGMAAALGQRETLAPVSAALRRRARVERVYLLDEQGRQCGPSLDGVAAQKNLNDRFRPLAEASGALWFRRPYFRRAVARPGEVQVSRPYRSISGGNVCITLSLMLPVGTPMAGHILCCDIDWSGVEEGLCTRQRESNG